MSVKGKSFILRMPRPYSGPRGTPGVAGSTGTPGADQARCASPLDGSMVRNDDLAAAGQFVPF